MTFSLAKLAKKVDTPLALKIAVVAIILMTPFLPYGALGWANSVVFKVAVLVVILGACFYDFQLAVLLTIAFLIVVLHLNQRMLGTKERFVAPFDNAPNDKGRAEDRQPQNLVCGEDERNNMNEDLMAHYIDEKVKPYEVFIRMMTSDEALRAAQGDL